MIKYLIRIPLFIALFSILLNMLLVLMFIWSYNALTAEQLIAKIRFDCPQASAQCTAILSDTDDIEMGHYPLYGEQWRIDAKFVKMTHFANLFGLDSRYVLERLEGRYKNINDANTQQHLAYDLTEDTLLDTLSLERWLPFIDAEYGSSTYHDIKPDIEYLVYRTQTGIITRVYNLNENSGFFEQFGL